MKTSIFKIAAAVAFLSVFILVTRSEATSTVVNVDLNVTNTTDATVSPTYSGQGAVLDPGNNVWNSLDLPSPAYATNVTHGSLLTSAGQVSGVSVTLKTDPAYGSIYPFTSGNPILAHDLLYDMFYINGNAPGYLTISGLTPGGTYSFYLIAQHPNGYGWTNDFTMGGQTETLENNGDTTGFVAGSNYLAFNGLIANGSGELFGSFTSNPLTGFGFQGFQLTETLIPEPSAVALLGLGGLLLWQRLSHRRRSRRAI